MRTRTIAVAIAAISVIGCIVGIASAQHGPGIRSSRILPVAATSVGTPLHHTYAVGNGNNVYAYWHADEHDVPWVVLVHGGSWELGRGGEPAMLRWAAREQALGYAAFSVDYRLVPKVQWPTPLEDVEHAIKWIRSRATSMSLDPNRGFLIGVSAGGQLGSAAALRLGGFAGVVDFAGAVDPYYEYLHGSDADLRRATYLLNDSRTPQQDPALWQDSRAEHYVGGHLMPFLLVHSVHDPIVPVQMSRTFYADLKAAGYPATLDILPGDDHPATTRQGLADANAWMGALSHVRSAAKILAKR